MNEYHGERGKRRIEQDPVCFVKLQSFSRNSMTIHLPIHVFSLLWHGSISKLSKAAKMVLEPESCGFIASRTDFGSAACRWLSAIDDRQYRIADEVSRMRHSNQAFLVVSTTEIDLCYRQSSNPVRQLTATNREELIPKCIDL
jgi:hypothetical protein